MNDPLRFLVLSGRTEAMELVRAELARAGFNPVGRCIDSFVDLQSALTAGHLRLVVVADESVALAGRVAEVVHATLPDALVVLLCGPNHESNGVLALDAGVDDYLLSDNLTRLGPLLRRQARRLVAVEPPSDACLRELFDNTPDAVAIFQVLGA